MSTQSFGKLAVAHVARAACATIFAALLLSAVLWSARTLTGNNLQMSDRVGSLFVIAGVALLGVVAANLHRQYLGLATLDPTAPLAAMASYAGAALLAGGLFCVALTLSALLVGLLEQVEPSAAMITQLDTRSNVGLVEIIPRSLQALGTGTARAIEDVGRILFRIFAGALFFTSIVAGIATWLDRRWSR